MKFLGSATCQPKLSHQLGRCCIGRCHSSYQLKQKLERSGVLHNSLDPLQLPFLVELGFHLSRNTCVIRRLRSLQIHYNLHSRYPPCPFFSTVMEPSKEEKSWTKSKNCKSAKRSLGRFKTCGDQVTIINPPTAKQEVAQTTNDEKALIYNVDDRAVPNYTAKLSAPCPANTMVMDSILLELLRAGRSRRSKSQSQ